MTQILNAIIALAAILGQLERLLNYLRAAQRAAEKQKQKNTTKLTDEDIAKAIANSRQSLDWLNAKWNGD
jgi:hypothetical protein